MVRTPSFYKARVNADAMVAFYTPSPMRRRCR
jgi:hypothetical protein